MFSCARIYVEVGLEKGFPEAILLTLDNGKHVQKLDYEQWLLNGKRVMNKSIFPKIARKTFPKLKSL